MAEPTAGPPSGPSTAPTDASWTSLATPPPAPVAPELPVGAYLFQFVLVTLALSAVLVVVLRVARDRLPGLGLTLQGSRSLRLVERVALDPQRAAFIVAVGRRHWLLAASGEQITPVAELSPEDVEDGFAALVDKERQAHVQPGT